MTKIVPIDLKELSNFVDASYKCCACGRDYGKHYGIYCDPPSNYGEPSTTRVFSKEIETFDLQDHVTRTRKINLRK